MTVKQFIYFGGNRQQEKCISHKIDVNGKDIQRMELNRYLGAYLDLSLKFHGTDKDEMQSSYDKSTQN